MNTLNKSDLLRPAIPVADPVIEDHLANLNLKGLRSWLDNSLSSADFFSVAQVWLKDFLGDNSLAAFPHKNLTTGTTGAFQDFYQINQGRRLRLLRGEYPFHRDVHDSLKLSWEWLDIRALDKNDFVIMSYPFSGDGEKTPQFLEILDHCESLGLPVLLDCAFAGLSEIQLPPISHYQCIKKICFSLSKIFNMGHFRCGFEFSKYAEGAGSLLMSWDYGPKASAYFGLQLMKQFPLNYTFKKYRAQQIDVCRHFGLVPSSTFLFGVGEGAEWKTFARDGFSNRVCLAAVLK